MYLFYTDETNLDPAQSDFFVYGGLTVPSDRARQLSEAMDALRTRFGLPPGAMLKFNPAPAGLDHDQFKALKQAVVELAIEHGCQFIATLTLHSIARNSDEARRFAINTIAYHFDGFLNARGTHGLVLIDRFTDAQLDEQLRDRFAVGVRGLPYSPTMRLQNIVGFHYAAIGQGHFGSLIDIVLGSFRFAVNAFTRGDEARRQSGDTILRLLAPLFIRNDDGRVSGIGLHFSPVAVRAAIYRTQYEALRTYLAECGIEASQQIRAEQVY
ncbi:DUF3800 domain-containing protein [Stenotrophomonas maltophilia]|nr:DUF3800 domain-containing protein [Stenotrophomonas maltophilia]MBA0410383.1 DUF3800 domain-containing protein [Stenotrophomonas maltophilia]MBA0425534.1 DUF3800 domain-containing protein [Stenotrophomonas maltophilia]HDS1136301.1 hypothetical protein [Stenotrophomonas maltophilia]